MILDVQLLPGSWLWGWEIRSAAGGSLIESSWTATWTAFPTDEEAWAAGQRRLTELRRTGGRGAGGQACAA